MDKYDPTKVTEFPRFETEPNQSGVSTFFSKLFRGVPLFSPNDVPEQTKSLPESKRPLTNHGQDNVEKVEEQESLSIQSVFRKISTHVAIGSGAGTRYADTELARYWMPDEIALECYECEAKFNALRRRRHHCRVCGHVFCSRCCSQRVPGEIFGCAGGLRVCNYCCRVVLRYLQENDMQDDISPNLRTLQESLMVKFPERPTDVKKHRDSFLFARDQRDQNDMRVSSKQALKDLYKQLSYSLPTQHHRYRFVRYSNVWRGCDMLQWVMENTRSKTRSQASEICQALVNEGYVECSTDMPRFADYALYKPLPLPDISNNESPEETNILVESVSSYSLDLNLGENSARLTKANKKDNKLSPSSENETPVIDENKTGGEREPSAAIAECGREHLRLLARQWLAREALPAAWLPVLLALCRHCAHLTLPDLYSNEIDIRNYVQVKKVPGGSVSESCVIPGVVLTKNVVHRGMPTDLVDPSVLLLDCSIAYQRAEGKFTSLEPLVLQEQEYLVRCAARISALRPRVVLVRGSAARAVQDLLRKDGVALATGVREKALRRTARCVKADIVTSIDSRIGMPRLGTCKKFYIKTYLNKTLMVLEGCAEPNLGCCMLLRGGSTNELARVKKVAKFMLLACYNWRFELAFLTDIGATLPDSSMELDDTLDFVPNDAKSSDEAKNKEGVTDQNNIITMNLDTQKRVTADNKQFSTDNEDSNISEPSDTDKGDSNYLQYEHHTIQTTKTQGIQAESNLFLSEKMKTVNQHEPISSIETIEDPLQNASMAYQRRLDSDKYQSVPIQDFSDPLHAKQTSFDDEVFFPKDVTKLTADNTTSDRWSTDDAVLSMSPNIRINAPFLETEAGKKCHLRQYFHSPLFNSPQPLTPNSLRRKISRVEDGSEIVFKESHPFISTAVTGPIDDPGFRSSLALYRAVGGRLLPVHSNACPMHKEPNLSPMPQKIAKKDVNENETAVDYLAPENHQRLSLLIYSFSSKSANVPDFCVNPWIVNMELYGPHDITLGAFLDKFCFDMDYKCPSRNCNIPMFQHIRKFVHGDSCITISCNTIGNSSNLVKSTEQQTKQIMWWGRCLGGAGCAGGGAGGRGARLSRAALALSLGKYLELRLRAPRYKPAHPLCPHSLHHHYAHHFAKGLTTAAFKYSKIRTWELGLPPALIVTNYDTKAMRDSLISQVNDLLLKGHEILSSVSESDAEREHLAFKQHMEQIHMALTSAALQEQKSLAGVVRCLWAVSDRVVAGEKMLQDAIDRYSNKNHKNHDFHETSEKSDVEDCAATEASTAESVQVEGRRCEAEGVAMVAGAGEEDEERGDSRKTVRAILSQLLSTSQPTHQNGIIISGGVIPVTVFGGEIGSVIAAALASHTYQLQLHQLLNNSAQGEGESVGGGSCGGEGSTSPAPKDKTDSDSRGKSTKSNEHIEVMLREGLVCRVYFAAQFQRLRGMLLAPLSRAPISDHFTPTDASALPSSDLAHATTAADCKLDLDSKDQSEVKHMKSKNEAVRNLSEIEEGFVRSLSNCVAWAARGGKSGSTFCKTKDDRYVLKEMSKQEWQQFPEFAPHYFNHVITCHQNKLPTLLARIVGVYSVGGAGNGVLVMENLFYGREDVTRFDLKGASRNRLAPHTEPLAVLMDENLLKLRWERPLYVGSHVGSVLWAGVERDTGFLARHHVMDYSLLLGLDHDTNHLVIGIIDYIRTFTWDKKLEHFVKILGSGQPTIVSPEQYRERFILAMHKYFLHCPDHWDALHRGLAPAASAAPAHAPTDAHA